MLLAADRFMEVVRGVNSLIEADEEVSTALLFVLESNKEGEEC